MLPCGKASTSARSSASHGALPGNVILVDTVPGNHGPFVAGPHEPLGEHFFKVIDGLAEFGLTVTCGEVVEIVHKKEVGIEAAGAGAGGGAQPLPAFVVFVCVLAVLILKEGEDAA